MKLGLTGAGLYRFVGKVLPIKPKPSLGSMEVKYNTPTGSKISQVLVSVKSSPTLPPDSALSATFLFFDQNHSLWEESCTPRFSPSLVTSACQ